MDKIIAHWQDKGLSSGECRQPSSGRARSAPSGKARKVIARILQHTAYNGRDATIDFLDRQCGLGPLSLNRSGTPALISPTSLDADTFPERRDK